MTTLAAPTTDSSSFDRFDVRLALRAPDLLREFNEAGVLAAADVHVAQRLSRLVGEVDETVILAAALAARHPAGAQRALFGLGDGRLRRLDRTGA